MLTSVNTIDSLNQESGFVKQVGKNLARVRKLAGFETIEEVSEVTNLSKNILEEIEQGNIEIYLSEIYILICLYNCPTHHIFEGYFDLSPIKHVQHSDMSECRDYVVDIIGFHKKIQGKRVQLVKAPLARGAHYDNKSKIFLKKKTSFRNTSGKKLSPSTLRRRADTLLTQNSLYQLPINVYQIASTLGISISFENFPSELYMKLKGFCYRDDDISLIGLNKSHPTVLQRFTLAHELHHYLYDFSAKRYLCGPENESIALERNAEKFAAELLMPSKYVSKLVSTPLNIRYLTINLVAKHFGVSYEASAVRLAKFGLISDLKASCSSIYKKKDKKKTKYLLATQLDHLSAVFGLETGIEELQSANKLTRKHSCGAYVNDTSHTVCWRCGLELRKSSQGYLNNPFRQSSFNTSPSKVSSLEERKDQYKQLSFNLNIQ